MDVETIPHALAELVESIKTSGVDAVTDPRYANPPCAIVQFDSFDRLTMCGEVEPKAIIYLVAPDNGLDEAMGTLFTMAGKLPPHLLINCYSDTVPVSGTAPLPALRIGPVEIGE